MKFQMHWEQMNIPALEIDVSPTGDYDTDPVTLCEALGESGREALLEVLLTNYIDEVKRHWNFFDRGAR